MNKEEFKSIVLGIIKDHTIEEASEIIFGSGLFIDTKEAAEISSVSRQIINRRLLRGEYVAHNVGAKGWIIVKPTLDDYKPAPKHRPNKK